MNRILRLVGLMLGVAIVVWLVLRSDPAAGFAAFARIGWGFGAVVAARLATIVIDWRSRLPFGWTA